MNGKGIVDIGGENGNTIISIQLFRVMEKMVSLWLMHIMAGNRISELKIRLALRWGEGCCVVIHLILGKVVAPKVCVPEIGGGERTPQNAGRATLEDLNQPWRNPCLFHQHLQSHTSTPNRHPIHSQHCKFRQMENNNNNSVNRKIYSNHTQNWRWIILVTADWRRCVKSIKILKWFWKDKIIQKHD